MVFGHVYANPADYPDRWARIVAEEVTANEFIKEPLPDGAILLKDFPCPGPMQSTKQRYELLQREIVRGKIAVPAGQALGEGQGRGGTLDDHTVWEQATLDRDKAKATVESVIHDVVLEVGMDRVPDDLKDGLRNLGIEYCARRRAVRRSR